MGAEVGLKLVGTEDGILVGEILDGAREDGILDSGTVSGMSSEIDMGNLFLSLYTS